MWCISSSVAYILGLMLLSPGPPVWEITRSGDGDFAFSMPVRPVSETAGARAPEPTIETISYSCSSGGSQYLLRRATYPRPVPADRVIAYLAQVRKTYFKENVRLVRETKITVDGVIGDDFTYTLPSPRGDGDVIRRTRHFLKDHFYYELTVSSPPGHSLPDDAARFLSSLTFEALVKAQHAAAGSRPKSSVQPERDARRPPTQTGGEDRRPVVKVDLVDGTPEAALRTFMLALAAQDEATLRAVSLPDNELDWLLKGPPAPATPEAIAEMKAKLERTPFRRLLSGARVRMPGNRNGVIQPSDVRDGRVVLLSQGAPYPARVEKFDGHWKVLARPFIVARKLAKAEHKAP